MIRFLGTFQVQLEGKEIPFPYQKMKALFAYLFCHQGKKLQKEMLASLLWPEVSDKKAKASFRNALYQIKKTPFEWDHYIEQNREYICLQLPASVESDIDHLQKLVKDENPVLYSAHAALVCGDFLEELCFDECELFQEWVEQQRNHYQSLHIALLQKLLKTPVTQEEQLQICWKLLSLEPWNDTIHFKVMSLYQQQNLPSAALNHFLLTRQKYKKELNIEPSKNLIDLFETIRLQSEEPQTKRQDQLQATLSFPFYATPYIQRKEEESIIETLSRKETRCVSIVGQGGIGKTRLACQIATRLHPIYADGIFFVTFSEFPSNQERTQVGIIRFLATQMGIQLDGNNPLHQQFFQFWNRKHALIIIDSFEAIDNEPAVFIQWLKECPALKLLLTSRLPTSLLGEKTVVLQGLETTSRAQITAADELFLGCIEQLEDHKIDLAQDREKLTLICKKLAGHPISIEHVAGWSKHLTADEILLQLEESNNNEQHLDPVLSMLNYSWSLLFQEQIQGLQLLSLATAPLKREHAIKLTNSSPYSFALLFEQGWLQQLEHGKKIRLHDVHKQYIQSKVEKTSLENKHKQQFFQFFFKQATQETQEQAFTLSSLKRVSQVWEHCKTALFFALEQKHIADIESFFPWFEEYSHVTLELDFATQFLSLLLDENLSPAFHKRCQLMQAEMQIRLRKDETTLGALENIHIAKGEAEYAWWKSLLLGRYYLWKQQQKLAKQHLEHALFLSSQVSSVAHGKSLYYQGVWSLFYGKSEDSLELYLEALRIFEKVSYFDRTRTSHWALSHVFTRLSRWDEAEKHVHQYYLISKFFDPSFNPFLYHFAIAPIWIEQQRFEETRAHLQPLLEELEREPIPTLYQGFCHRYFGRCSKYEGKYDEASTHVETAMSIFLLLELPFYYFEDLEELLEIKLQEKDTAHAQKILWQLLQYYRKNTSKKLHIYLYWALLLQEQGKLSESFQMIQFVFSHDDYESRKSLQEKAKTALQKSFDSLSHTTIEQLSQTAVTEESMIVSLLTTNLSKTDALPQK